MLVVDYWDAEEHQKSIDRYERKAQVNSLPVLYSSYCIIETQETVNAIGKTLEWFAELRAQEITTDYILTPRNLDEQIKSQRQANNQELIETGVLEDLNEVLNKAKIDRNSIMNPPKTDDIMVKQTFDDNVQDFYEQRLYYHAEEICQHIQGLIELDKYPELMFGKFNEIREKIFKENDPKIANRMLGQLIIIGRSSIPRHVKSEEPETIENNSSSQIRTM